MKFKSLTEGMDTITPSGELLFHMFGALAQYERALIRERVMAGLEVANRRGRKEGMSKAAVCRNFGVKRTTLIDTLKRIGWPSQASKDVAHPSE